MRAWSMFCAGLVLLIVSVPVQAQEKAPMKLTADLLTGTWNVVCKPTPISTCGESAKTTVVQWLLAAQEDQTISVTVLGKSDVAAMAGTFEGTGVFANGEGKRLSEKGGTKFAFGDATVELYGSQAVVFHLSSESQFQGKAYVVETKNLKKKAVTCFSELSCTGTKL